MSDAIRVALESAIRTYESMSPGVMTVERKQAIDALQALQSGEPFAWCFTDVNGKPKELVDHPKYKSEQDMRIYTPLYTTPQPVVEGSVPMSDYKQLSALCSRQGMRFMDYEADLEKMGDALEKAATHLREAAELVADWGAYTDDYFKDKHDLQADIKLCKDRADAIDALLSAGKGGE